jgi:diacylglycerol kinase (ATP)
MTDKEWFVIVNPNAGRRKGEKDWLEIARLLDKAGIKFTSVFTEHKDHALNLTHRYIDAGFKNIIVVGGDGTLNEVVNGVFLQKKCPTTEITLAMIPVGTGNDWCRMFGIPLSYNKAIAFITRGKTFLQDAGSVSFFSSDSTPKTRYFINMAGMGYDALVAKKTNLLKESGKIRPFSYLLNMLTSLFSYQTAESTITFNGKTIGTSVFSMSVGICQYNGGGMKQAPNAIPDDGLFDLTIITKVTKFEVFRNIKKLFDGTFIQLPQVSSYTADKIVIESTPALFLEVDGESLGHTPFQFEVVPLCVKVITGN